MIPEFDAIRAVDRERDDGGEIALDDVSQSVKAGRPVAVIAGTGRLADSLVAALRGDEADRRTREIASSGLPHAVDPTEGFDTFAFVIKQIRSARG